MCQLLLHVPKDTNILLLVICMSFTEWISFRDTLVQNALGCHGENVQQQRTDPRLGRHRLCYEHRPQDQGGEPIEPLTNVSGSIALFSEKPYTFWSEKRTTRADASCDFFSGTLILCGNYVPLGCMCFRQVSPFQPIMALMVLSYYGSLFRTWHRLSR